jgi:hypothetical protein
VGKQADRKKIIEELQAGHLGAAMSLLGESGEQVDKEMREEAVAACVRSLQQHFHWIVPLYVEAFGIGDDVRLNQLAAKIVVLSLQHNQPLIAEMAARTFGIHLDDSISQMAAAARANLISSRDGIASIQGVSGEYKFKLD